MSNKRRQALRAPTLAPLTDRDVLRALTEQADYLGRDQDGSAWLLVRTTPQLVEWLATMDAPTEDCEDGGHDEDGDEDMCVEDAILRANGPGGHSVPLAPPYNEDDEPDDHGGAP